MIAKVKFTLVTNTFLGDSHFKLEGCTDHLMSGFAKI